MLRRDACKAARLIRGHLSEIFEIRPTGGCLAVRAFSSALCDTSCFQEYSSPRSGSFSGSGDAHLHKISRGFSAGEGLDGPSTDGSAGHLQDASTPSIADDGGFLGADAISQAAEMASLAESWDNAWFINKGFQWLIQTMHETTGSPWWASIALATILCRCGMIPFTIKQMKNLANMQNAKPEMEQLTAWYNEKKEMGLATQYQPEMTQRMADVWRKYDCHPLKSLLPPIAQAPVFIGFFGALRSMAEAKIPSLAVGGLPYLWYQDLTLADPYYTLPILSSAIFLVSVELNMADGMQGQGTTAQSRMKMFMRFIAVLIIPFTSSMPQGVFCYWITSNTFTLVQGAVLKMERVKQRLGLPSPAVANQGKATSAELIAATASPGKPIQTFANRPSKSQTSRQKKAGQAGKDQGRATVRQWGSKA